MVVVQRHGVRSPTKAPEALAKYAALPWPAWPVAPGELTAHGARDVRLMGAWLRQVYAAKGLLPAKGCPAPGQVFAWADGADQRTRVSGDAVLEGAFPGCGLSAAHGPEGQADPLFDAVSSGACPIDADLARAAVLARVRDDLEHPGPGYEAAKAALSQIVAPGVACKDDQGVCAMNGHNSLRVQDGTLKLDGPLAVGATLSENLLLEYAQGMPSGSVGWGRAADGAAIASVMPLHEIQSDLMRRTPYLASHNGALLARAVADAVDGRTPLTGEGAAAPRLLIIAGHDTNLANLAGILGLDWTLPGQPDSTPPSLAMAFEVWRDPASGARFVKIALIYQTLEQLRAETVLDAAHPAGRVEPVLTGCQEGPGKICPAPRLRAVIEAVVPPACHR
ncbi:MAG: hypothetical protein P4L64_03620 [Caulobacteraceae bacterium]|nr:hypothetical protein [Caulobacteraceae bacterium]